MLIPAVWLEELERVASALARFAGELREVVTKGDRLRAEVAEFRARVAAAPVGESAGVGFSSGFGADSGFGGDSTLGLDPVLATQNAFLTSRIAALAEELVEAERACAAAVRAVDGWQERAAGLLFNTARGVATDRMPWGDPGGPESCAGQAIEQVMVGIWNSGSGVTFLSAYPILSRLGGPGVSPADQHAAWAEAGRSLIGWGVSEGEGFVEGLVQDIAVGLDDVATWAEGTATDVVDWSSDQIDALWQTGVVAVAWASDRAQDASDRVDDMADATRDWVTDTRGDVETWGAGPGAEIGDDWVNFGAASAQLYEALNSMALRGEAPRVTEVVASVVLAGGALYGATGTTLNGGTDPYNVFDDGEPILSRTPEGLPIPGMVYNAGEDGHPIPVAPQGIPELIQGVSDAYDAGSASGGAEGYVRVTTIEREPGVPPRVIVSIPGTQPWDPHAGGVAADVTGNFVTAGGGRSTMTEAVMNAIADTGNVPADAQIMLVGHSQGGMTAADIASDPEFLKNHNVTNVVAFGAPIDSTRIGRDVDVLELQHVTDVVPRLDLEDKGFFDMGTGRIVEDGLEKARDALSAARDMITGNDSGSGHTTVTMPNPGAWDDAETNHLHREYRNSVEEIMDPEATDGSGAKRLANYQESLDDQGFLIGDESQISVRDIRVGRKD